MTILSSLMLLIWAAALGLTILGTWLTLKHLSTPPPHLDAPFRLFPVTVLKPLKGAESGIYENLESFFHLDYPIYEILFSVADLRDPACALVEALLEKYPNVPARLIIGDVQVGLNPKVNNMMQSYQQAKYDWLLVSDSNVRVGSDYLKRLVAHLEPGVGMITSLVAGRYPGGLGGHLESTFLNTFYARGMTLAFWAGHPLVIGKSMMFRKSTAARFGGIQALARYLAEDYIAGEAVRQLGLRVVLAADPVEQYIGTYASKDFWSRHIRWGRIRKAQAPLPFMGEFISCSMISGLLGMFAASHLFGIPPVIFMVIHLGAWSLCDLLMMMKMGENIDLGTPLVWFLRELAQIPLWLHIASGNTVNWRNQKLRLLPGGILDT
jgi:ceramide glucosyltransferase